MSVAYIEPDAVFCDEGHTLKSDDAEVFKCAQLIETRRRVSLTGTPMQNHLVECEL